MQKLLSRLFVLIFILSLTIQPINIFAQEEPDKSDEIEDIEETELISILINIDGQEIE